VLRRTPAWRIEEEAARGRNAAVRGDTVTGTHARRCDGGAVVNADSIVTTLLQFFYCSSSCSCCTRAGDGGA